MFIIIKGKKLPTELCPLCDPIKKYIKYTYREEVLEAYKPEC